MADTNEYTELIAGYHSNREKFTQWIYELTEPVKQAREKISGFVFDYDIDQAIGEQLNGVGVRVGASRKLKTRITNVFFAFDDVDGKGFDFGIWKTPRDSATAITELSDEIFRTLVKAKVALNQYSGDNESIRDLIVRVMMAFGVDSSQFGYVDNQNMSISVFIDRPFVPPIVWELFYNNIFALNHAGVELKLVNGNFGTLATTDDLLITTPSGDYLVMDKTNA